MEKRRWITIISILLILFPGTIAFGASMVVRLAHVAPTEDPRHFGAMEFKKVLEAETGNKIQVNVFPAGQLGVGRDLIESAQVGGLETFILPPSFLGGFQPLTMVIDIPYLFPVDPKKAREKIDGPAGRALFDTLEEVNLHGLSFWEGCYKHFTANKPLKAPADFKGMKFRVMPSPILMAMIESLGGNAIQIPYTETYIALQTKTVDGQEANLESIYNMKFHEVQRFLSMTYHIKSEFVLIASKKWYDGLSSENKAAVNKAAKAGKALHDGMYWGRENKAGVDMEKQGIKTINLTPDEINVLKSTTSVVKKSFAEKYGTRGKNLIEMFEK